MSVKSLVSVVIIFLNEEKFIQEAIDSVFSQTYHYWELLLVDDGSMDGSTGIALQCAKRHPGKVRYLDHAGHENRGATASRNLGSKQAKGEYIAFLDADDVWLPQKLERQVAILEGQAEAAMVYGATQYWHSWTGNAEDIPRDYVPDLGVATDTLVRPPTLLRLCLESRARTACPSDILLRRKVLESIGGFEEQFYGMLQLFEDHAFLAKVYLKAPVFVASECWDRYRIHPESCVSVVTKAGQKYAAGLFYLRWLEKYLSEQGVKDAALWKALRRKMRRYRHPRLWHWIEHKQRQTRRVKARAARITRRALSLPIWRWVRSD